MKDRVVARLRPPESLAIGALSQRVGISVTTLERWRSEALTGPARERAWSAPVRLEAVVATATLDDTRQNAWGREHGPTVSLRTRTLAARRERSARHSGRSTRQPHGDTGRQKAHQEAGSGTTAQRQGPGRNRRTLGALKRTLCDLPPGGAYE